MKTICPFDGGLLFQVGPIGYWHCPICKVYFSEYELELIAIQEVQILTRKPELLGELSETPWLDGEN